MMNLRMSEDLKDRNRGNYEQGKVRKNVLQKTKTN